MVIKDFDMTLQDFLLKGYISQKSTLCINYRTFVGKDIMNCSIVIHIMNYIPDVFRDKVVDSLSADADMLVIKIKNSLINTEQHEKFLAKGYTIMKGEIIE